MDRERRARAQGVVVAVLAMAGMLSIACTLAPSRARAATDGFPTANPGGQAYFSPIGALYKASPSTLADGERDELHTNASHELGVTLTLNGVATIGSVAQGSPNPNASGAWAVTEGDDLAGETIAHVDSVASNGASNVTLVSAVAAKQVRPYVLGLTNTDTIEHVVILKSSGGTVVYPPIRVPAGAGTTSNLSFGQVLLGKLDLCAAKSVSGEGLSYSSDSQAAAKVFAHLDYSQR